MKGLIEEANKIAHSPLRSKLHLPNSSSASNKGEDSRSEMLSRLQAETQLPEGL